MLTPLARATDPLLSPTPASAEIAPALLAAFLDHQVDRLGEHRTQLLQALVRTQLRFGWIPPQAVSILGRRYGASGGEIRGLIDFYHFLSDRFQGGYRLLLSHSITDLMAGQADHAERLCQRLGLRPGQLREDGRVSLDFTSCTGLCDQGPAALVNGHPLVRLDRQRVDQLADLIEAGQPLDRWPTAWFRVEPGIRHPDRLLDASVAPGAALRAAVAGGVDAFLVQLECSGLRGRGGAGFSTYRKLRSACRTAPGGTHYLVCNADEGEPGTFKDRVLLDRQADAVFEGMTLAAWVVGARRGFLYLRGEYAFLHGALTQSLDERRRRGWLGRAIGGLAGFDFDIEIHLGAGAYVCGEESALIESLEGRRGVPRLRPPFPVARGYRGQPTLVNNVETFACITRIALEGGAAFARQGTAGAAGTKLHSVSGDCRRPGVYEFPWGLTVRELLRHCGGNDALAVQVGGPSGDLLFEEEFGRRLAFDDLPTGGAFMVFGRARDPLAIVDNFSRFFAQESCGFCLPCRAGTAQLCELVGRFRQRRAREGDLARLRELIEATSRASHCGLGRTAARPLQQLLEKRPGLLEAGIAAADRPGFDLEAALAPAARLRRAPR